MLQLQLQCPCEYTTKINYSTYNYHCASEYVSSIHKEEKDLSVVALVTGKVKYILSNLSISVSIFL